MIITDWLKRYANTHRIQDMLDNNEIMIPKISNNSSIFLYSVNTPINSPQLFYRTKYY